MKLFVATFFVSMIAGVALFTFNSELGLPGLDVFQRFGFSLVEETETPVVDSHLIQPAFVLALAVGNEQAADSAALIESMDLGFAGYPIQAFIDGLVSSTDTTRRAGAIAYFETSRTTPCYLGFVPVVDPQSLESLLTELGEVIEGKPNQLNLSDGNSCYFWYHHDYVFFASHLEAFDYMDVDPEFWIESLSENYNLAFKINIEAIPQSVRDQSISQVLNTIRQSAKANGKFSSKEQAESVEQVLSPYLTMIRETEALTIGLELDHDAGKIILQSEIVSGPTSMLARYGEQAKQLKPSRFAGFRQDGALVNMNFCSPILREQSFDLELLANFLEETGGFPDARLDQLANESGRALKRTIKQGRADASVVCTVDASGFNLAAVVHIPDTEKIANILDDLIQPKGYGISQFGSRSQKMVVNHLAGSHRGINFYQHMETMDKGSLSSQRIAFVVGASKNEVLLGMGSDPTPLLKQCIDACIEHPDDATSDFSVECNLMQLAKLGNLDDNERNVMGTFGGNEQILMNSKFTGHGTRFHFEMDFEILKACWKIGESQIHADLEMNDLD